MLRRFAVLWVCLISIMVGCAQSRSKETITSAVQQRAGITGLEDHNRGSFPDTLGVPPDSLHAIIEREKEALTAEIEHVEEALEAVKQTQDVVKALKKGKKDSAFVGLEKVVGRLDLLLARYPETDLIPIDFSADIMNLTIDLEAVKEARGVVADLVDDGSLQEARQILDGLVSEIRFTRVYLPMEIFPSAIKEASTLLEQDKTSEAQTLLQDALATLVVVENSVPLPFINAEVMVQEAAKVAGSDREKAQKHLEDAQYQIRLAKALGYGKKDGDYDKLEKEIQTDLHAITKGENTDGLFDSLSTTIRRFRDSI